MTILAIANSTNANPQTATFTLSSDAACTLGATTTTALTIASSGSSGGSSGGTTQPPPDGGTTQPPTWDATGKTSAAN